MPQLSPLQAALFAKFVYDVRLSELGTSGTQAFVPGFVRMERFEGTSGVTVTSGVSSSASTTGFGFFARGAQPLNKCDLVFAIRGTHMTSAQDWLSNFNMAMDTFDEGPGRVHSGFYGVFRSFKSTVERAIAYVSQTQVMPMGTPITTVHVVGHSLGGALATITASFIKTSLPGVNVRLYTFGSPRAGDETFCRSVTATLGGDNMKRIYHNADPVPMVPVWPFHHVPYIDEAGLGNLLSWGTGMTNASAHGMREYKRSVMNSTWDELDSASSQVFSDAYTEQIKRYLRGQEMTGGVRGALAAMGNMAFQYVANAATDVLQTTGLTLAEGFTAVDQIALLINQASSGTLSGNATFNRYIDLLANFAELEQQRESGSTWLGGWLMGRLGIVTPLTYLKNRMQGMMSSALTGALNYLTSGGDD